jgi:ssDNA-binding Zn-finger/Zn-ribbon topoisomerase 1
MKYAALIFGDDERQPKAASGKLPSPEPGQIVRGIDGSVYRVASKITGPDGYAVKLANLQGQPVQTPHNFRPVAAATARFASWLKYHLAYNRDFDLYINAYIERYNEQVAQRNKDIQERNAQNPETAIPLEEPLPFPIGHDGKPFRWANWFQGVISPKLFIPGSTEFEDKQVIKDELIHEMLFNVLGQRNILEQFVAKADSFGGGVNKQNAGKKLTDFLIRTFMYRVDEMQNKIREHNPTLGLTLERQIEVQRALLNKTPKRRLKARAAIEARIKELEAQLEDMGDMKNTPVEMSMWQQGETDEGEGDTNILEHEEYGIGEGEFQSAEAKRDVTRFRLGFMKWLEQTQGRKAADSFILLFDIFWRILQDDEDAEIKRSDFEQEWIKKTGLSFGSFKDYFTRLPDMIEQFITSHSDELGDKNIFVDLMNIIREERAHPERKNRMEGIKERARPAMVSSLNTAGVEGDFTQAISNTENPDVVDPDIKQPTESASEAAKVSAEDDEYTCMKCHRTSDASDSNNLQCPHCGGNMKTAEYSQEDWERDERAQYDLERIEEAKHWEGEEGDDKTAAVKIAKLVRGDQLTPEMAKQVQDAFIYRWTSDNKRRGDVYHCDKCDVRHDPYVNTQSAEGHQHPTIPLESDAEWLKGHAFYFTNAGKLQPRRHAQPAYLAPDETNPILASVAHKFAMEKAAYNPGKGEYIFRADVYCETCGEAYKRALDKQGKAPADPSDESSYDSDQYPKGPYYDQDTKADGPQHCGRCGVFLENPLTIEGYQYLNQMILEHEADGKGQSDTIDEWKAFYPEREEMDDSGVVDATLSQVEHDTDKDFLRGMNTAGKKAMIPHEFNDADGQAIRNETYPDTAYVSGEADTNELRKPRMANSKTAIDPSSVLNVTEPRKPTPLHKRPAEPVAPTHPLQTRESEQEGWQCMDCGAVGQLDNKGGGCETCGSQAVFPVSSTGVDSPDVVRETKPVEVEKRMIPRRSPKPLPLKGSENKTAQGSGNTTVTMQEQNVTTPNTPGRGEPMAVPEAIDQTAGPHSPNAPATAPRTPGIQPKIVTVPAGTEGDAEMSNTASANDPEEVSCPKCGGGNIDFDVDGDTVSAYCEDCEEVTHQGRLAPGSPVRDYRENPGDEWGAIERMGEVGGEFEEGPEPDVDAMYEADRLDQFDKQSGLEWIGGRLDEEERAFVRTLPESEVPCPDCGTPLRLNEIANPNGAPKKDYICPKCESVFSDEEQHTAAVNDNFPEFGDEEERYVDEQVDKWLEEHGWVKENEHHGATWWMGRQMWYKKDHEESIPYQSTDDAVEKELELIERQKEKTGAGSNSGDDDPRGAGDLWRENFYEHRTKGLSSNGLLTGMKDATGENPAFDDLDAVWTEPNQAPDDEEIRMLGTYLAESGTATSVPSGIMLAEKWRQARWAVSGKDDIALLNSMGIQAAAPAAPVTSPNVQQQMNLVRPQVQPTAPGGTTVAIMPSEEDPGNGSGKQPLVKKHTVEPELPNAKYHMMGSLIASEQDRLAKQAFGVDTPPCRECGEIKPDTMWHVFDEFSDINDPTKSLEGFYCEDCALEIAQDI